MMKERFEAESNSNVLFVTRQCSNRCIMCCEPPGTENDLEFCFRRNVRLIETAPKDTREVCVTGGEPTVNREMFLALLRKKRRMECFKITNCDLRRFEIANCDIKIKSSTKC